ncbi:Fic family protein [Corynebacterium aquatimens]|uniref:Fic/DOC family protein n=1 Tax=Corynebacterium TaxID=1716 RepID=UPI001F292636|nr:MULTISPECIES: Fic family protein [Corynebacterium]QYH19534.1 Fic family protein [Corynebacterium aquatimens]UIZ91515.1 Fic family protein [Corynebacterium sp. CNCTC7651]
MAQQKPRFRVWDDYYIPGTRVLRNLLVSEDEPFGVSDPDLLTEIETSVAAVRLDELAANPMQGHFDYTHFKAIHRHIFQDVYEWAGEERVAPTDRWMTKGGHAYYPAGPVMTEAAETQFRRLAKKHLLQGLPQEEFVTELAEIWGEINVIHPFREGNTRTQVVFFAQLVGEVGFTLDPAKFLAPELRDAFIAARFHSQDTGDNSKLAEVLARIVG